MLTATAAASPNSTAPLPPLLPTPPAPANAVLVIAAVDVADTVRSATGAPLDPTGDPSMSALTVFWMSPIATPAPIAAPMPVPWPAFVNWSAIAPAVPVIVELSAAVTLTAAGVASVLPFCTSASVSSRIVSTANAPAAAIPTPRPVPEPVTLPAAPMARAKMELSVAASTVIGPPAVTWESSISASATLGVPSPPIVLIANEAPSETAAAVPRPCASEIETAPATATILESLLAVTVTAPSAPTVLERSVADVSASIWLIEPEPAPAAATPLPCCLATAAEKAPATVKASMLLVEVASMRSSPVAPLAHWMSLDSTSASVSVVILLTAMATPADTAVALPEPPLAMARERLPAIATMSEESGPRMRTSLGAPGSSRREVSSMRARVAPVMSLSDTEPASEPAKVPPLPPPEPPEPPPATAPAPPAASVQMFARLSASSEKRSCVVSTTKSWKGTPRSVACVSRTNASTFESTPL